MADNKPEVAVIMGSASDWETMKHACEMLDQFEVPYMKQVISAHRTPELMGEFAHNARANGLKVIIAGAGGDLAVLALLRHETGASYVLDHDTRVGCTVFEAPDTPDL